jgi:hypothetical protein
MVAGPRRLDEGHIAVTANDASLADNPSGPNRPQEVDVELQGRLELVGLEGREQGRSDRVVEHRGNEGSEHVARRVGEVVPPPPAALALALRPHPRTVLIAWSWHLSLAYRFGNARRVAPGRVSAPFE